MSQSSNGLAGAVAGPVPPDQRKPATVPPGRRQAGGYCDLCAHAHGQQGWPASPSAMSARSRGLGLTSLAWSRCGRFRGFMAARGGPRPAGPGRGRARGRTGIRCPRAARLGVHPAPGCTPGHVPYFRPGDRVLISGGALVTVRVNSVTGLLMRRPGVSGPPWYTTWHPAAARQSPGRLARLEPAVLAAWHAGDRHGNSGGSGRPRRRPYCRYSGREANASSSA
jgi:hypothetical protein